MASEDRALVVRLQSGDEAAFRELVEKYKKMAFAVARDYLGNDLDAEDASQEAFMKVFTNIGQFRGDARFSSWFDRIVLNCCINKTRRKSYNAELSFGDSPPETLFAAATETHDPERAAQSRLLQEDLSRALETLSHKQRIIFVLRFYHDLPIKEIGEIVQCSAGTVKSQLFRTVRKLQKALFYYRSECTAG